MSQRIQLTRSGDGAEQNFGLGEGGLFAGVDDVAHHGQFASAAEGETVDGGDDRFGHRGNAIPMTQEIATENAGEFVGLHLFNVGARGERPTVTWKE